MPIYVVSLSTAPSKIKGTKKSGGRYGCETSIGEMSIQEFRERLFNLPLKQGQNGMNQRGKRKGGGRKECIVVILKAQQTTDVNESLGSHLQNVLKQS